MPALWIVEQLDIIEYILAGLLPCFVSISPDPFGLEGGEEAQCSDASISALDGVSAISLLDVPHEESPIRKVRRPCPISNGEMVQRDGSEQASAEQFFEERFWLLRFIGTLSVMFEEMREGTLFGGGVVETFSEIFDRLMRHINFPIAHGLNALQSFAQLLDLKAEEGRFSLSHAVPTW